MAITQRRFAWTLTALAFLSAHLSAQNPCAPDTEPPVLITRNMAGTSISPFTLQAAVQPDLLLLSATDNCTSPAQLEFGIREAGTGSGFPEGQTVLYYDCDYMGLTLFMEVWARDAAGNTSWATEPFTIDEPPGPGYKCGYYLEKSLGIACAETESGQPVHRFSLNLGYRWNAHDSLHLFRDETVDECRFFSIAGDGFIALSKNKHPLNGVSTLDLILINKHILGTEPFNSPYKIIAADANRSGQVTMLDILELKKLILGIYDRLPNNTSWRFFPKEHVFANPAHPFPGLPQDTIPTHFGSAVGWAYQGDFVGVKVGDVNETADPVGLAAAAEARGQWALQADDRVLPAGVEIEIPLTASQAMRLQGCQLALRVDPEKARLLGLNADGLPGFSEQDVHQTPDGALRMVWLGDREAVFQPGDPVLSVRVLTLAPGAVADFLKLDENWLPAEGILPDGSSAGLRLDFGNAPRPAVWPSPFVDELHLRVDQPLGGRILWQLFDLTGRLVQERRLDAPEGLQNRVIGGLAELPAGVYQYRISSANLAVSGLLIH
ncbi:MAG: hypothetical protein IT260_10105 [Saprospiraceae bacterium]|nr:hypothetical protein [Saprospiraceae bacterium]